MPFLNCIFYVLLLCMLFMCNICLEKLLRLNISFRFKQTSCSKPEGTSECRSRTSLSPGNLQQQTGNMG